MRYDDLKADEIIYVVDKRQSLHFEQVFEASEKLGIAPGVKMLHIGFGTVNGADGKPFKTRDGGVMNLEDLIAMSKDKVRESMPKPEETDGYDAAYIENLVGEIAIGAIKFQDLKNTISAGYVFELDVAVNNATSGLHLAATALNVKPGDKVIVTPMTFAVQYNIRLPAGQ